ncbi:hypothetical protein [Neobacillus sp. FSL H8-0543]|uniref:hypothetical protein n=1 Tax=Neobacillus sp. FSL H8-0543 TaxID=2954672 RepID=UPI003158580A
MNIQEFLMKYEKFLRQVCKLGESSIKDYIGRGNGLINRGIYNGESTITATMLAEIERQYKKNSVKNYVVALRYMIESKKKNE